LTTRLPLARTNGITDLSGWRQITKPHSGRVLSLRW